MMESSGQDTPLGTETYTPEWGTWTRRVAVVCLLIALLTGAALLRPALSIVIIAAILAYLLYFPVRALSRCTPLSHGLSVGLVFLAYIVIALVALYFLAVPMGEAVSELVALVRAGLDEFVLFLEGYTPDQGWLVNEATGDKTVNLNFILEPLSVITKRTSDARNLEQMLQTLTAVAGALSTGLGVVTGFFMNLLLVHLLALFLLLEAPLFGQWAVQAVPVAYRREAGVLSGRIGRLWSSYLRGNLLLAALAGLLNGLAMWALGISYAGVIGVLTAFYSLIPILGGILSVVTIALVTLVSGSMTLALSPLAVTAIALVISGALGFVIWNVIFPKIAGGAVALPISVILVGVVVGTAVGGVLGTLLVVPIIAILREIVTYVLKKVRGGDPYPGEPMPVFMEQAVSALSTPVGPEDAE